MKNLLLNYALYEEGIIKVAKIDDVKRDDIVKAVKQKLNIPLSYIHMAVVANKSKTKTKTKTAANVTTLSPTTKINKDNFMDALNGVGDHLKDNKEVFDNHDKKIKEVKQESKTNTKTIDLLNKIVDVVTVLVGVNKTASMNSLVKIASMIVAEEDGHWTPKEWTLEQWKDYKKQHPKTKIKPKMKKEDKEKEDNKDEDEENKKDEKERTKKINEAFGGETEKPFWFEEGINPKNKEDMIKRGFTKKQADLSDDTTLVDVTTGTRYKYSELPKDLQKELMEANSKEGLWHTPSDHFNVGEVEEEELNDVQKELMKKDDEEPKLEKEESKEDNDEDKYKLQDEESDYELTDEELGNNKEKVEPKENKEKKVEPKSENKEDETSSLKNESNVDKEQAQSKPKKKMKVDTQLHAFLTNMPGQRKDLIDPLEKLNSLSEDKQQEIWYDWFGNTGKDIDLKTVIKKMIDWNKSDKKAVSVKTASYKINIASIVDDLVVEHFVEAVLKDKDLMRDTGGITKNRFKAPKIKPPRMDCKNFNKERRKNKEQRETK